MILLFQYLWQTDAKSNKMTSTWFLFFYIFFDQRLIIENGFNSRRRNMIYIYIYIYIYIERERERERERKWDRDRDGQRDRVREAQKTIQHYTNLGTFE